MKNFLSDKAYNILKWICLTALPLFESFITGMGLLYEFPTDKIVGTMALVATLIGGLLGVSCIAYNKGINEHMEGTEGEE